MSEAQGVNSVEIAVQVLDAVAQFNHPIRAVDIAAITGLSKSRLHKYLVSLCRSGMMYQNPENSLYGLGTKIGHLALAADKQNGHITVINKTLCQLRDKLNISTGLVIVQDNELWLIHYNRSNKAIDIDYQVNTQVPLNHSAAGKVFLAFSQEFANQSLLSATEIAEIRAQGYSTRLKEESTIPGAKSISCPIYDSAGNLVAAAVVMGFLPEDKSALNKIANELMSMIKQLRLPAL